MNAGWVHPAAGPRLQLYQQFIFPSLTLPCSAQRDVAVQASDNQGNPTVPAEPGDTEVTFNYYSDGHYKATIEDVLKKSSGRKLYDEHAPWNLGWYDCEHNALQEERF